MNCASCPEFPENALSDAQIRESISLLLNGLITLHLQDARPYAAGGDGLRMSGGCLLTRIWLALLEGMRVGEISFCPSCGKPFLITQNRGSTRVWCEMNGACAKRGQRARNFGRWCKLGCSPVIAGKRAGMKPSAARKLLERLGELSDDVDYGA